MLNDLRYALRLLVKSPGFSLIAIATLALGIGANTAIFSVVEGTLLRPLPFPHADRLVRVYEAADDNGARGSSLNLSEQTVQQWRDYGSNIFEDLAAATGANVTVGATAGNAALTVQAARVSANFLSVLGLPPALGRNFTPAEDKPGGPHVTIISDDFWKQYLGGRSDVLGLTLSSRWRSAHGHRCDAENISSSVSRRSVDATCDGRAAAGTGDEPLFYGVARLRPGITIAQASDAVRRMCAAINQSSPNPNNARAAYMPPLRESFVMDLRPEDSCHRGRGVVRAFDRRGKFCRPSFDARDRTGRRICVTRCAWRELAPFVPATNHPSHRSRTCRNNGRLARRFVDYAGARGDESGRRGRHWQRDARVRLCRAF